MKTTIDLLAGAALFGVIGHVGRPVPRRGERFPLDEPRPVRRSRPE